MKYNFIKRFYNQCKYSIRYKFTLTIILIALLPMSFSYFYLYGSIYSTLEKNAEKLLMNSINIINNNLERQFDIIDQTSMLFLSNITLRSVLEDESYKKFDYTQPEKNLLMDQNLKSQLLFNYAWDRKWLDSVFILENPDVYYFITRNGPSPKIIDNNVDVYNYVDTLEGEKHFIPPTEENPIIYFIRNINDLNTQELIGRLILGIDVDSLSQTDERLIEYDNVQIFTFDDNGIIYSHTDRSLLGQKVDNIFRNLGRSSSIHDIEIDGKEYFVTSMEIDKYNLTSIIAIPKSEVLFDLISNMRYYRVTIWIGVVLSLIIGLYISSRLVKPIKLITNVTQKVKKGIFHETLPPSKYTELNQFSVAFNTMIDEIDYLINEVYEKQLLIKESELAMLQSQINPHFLFNVLETIGWEAVLSNNDKINEMITSLGQLIRASITLGSREKISIGEELEYINSYLCLQKIRYEDRLDFEVNIADDSLSDYFIPKLSVIPLVENAIVHGLEEKRGIGHLEINIYRTEMGISFEIIDDGKGFDATSFDFNSIESFEKRKSTSSSIGLYNSHKRIKLMYGNEYGLSIESKIDVGTMVILQIPLDDEEDFNVSTYDS
ncbi:sensor histidine kinase [Wukongibacter baidiensis]|uniref:sensor histidine kinase n=1 Tax=Wukongibacter baidiensis TaxID=1723361 RepID=UPI003D7F9106